MLQHGPEDDWLDLSEEVAELTASQAGATMFSFAAAKIISSEVSQICDTHVKTLTTSKINEERIRTVKAEITEQCGALRNIAFLPTKRQVQFS